MSAAKTPRVLVVGAGIAGFSLALGLNARGISVVMLEKRPALIDGGYVVGIYKNGLDVLARFGIRDEVEKIGWRPERQILEDRFGRALRRTEFKALQEKHGVVALFLRRGDLVSIMRDAAATADNEILFGESIAAISESARGARATFESGEEREFDFVVGADGVNSRTRELLFGGGGIVRHDARFYHYVCAGGGLTLTDDVEMLGARAFLGAYPVSPSMRGVYAAVYPAKDGRGENPADVLRRRFGDFRGIAPALLADLGAIDVFGDDMREIVLPRWRSSRCVLIGDAAHALLPTTGQGLSLAMEDGLLLADVLAGEPYSDAADRLAAFEKKRRRRVASIRRASLLSNVVVARTPDALCGARDFCIRLFFGGGKFGQFDRFFSEKA